MELFGAGLAAGLAALGAALANGWLFSKYMDASARQPELEPKLKSSSIMMFALIEGLPILAIVVAILIIFFR